ncbi:MAG: ImmA/IrrE family metallo-endopeptidase [Firmicutes bacterium]|nr:ImmA/IrrE family metallo-endopeptidase [Bacillota bacterium]
MVSIGERIRRARRAVGLSMRDLADRVGVSHQAIFKYERDEDVPSSGVLLRLADALGVKIEYFFRTRTAKVSGLAYRKLSGLPRKAEWVVLEQIQEWLERYLEVEDLFPEQIRRFALPSSVDRRVSSVEEAERVSEELRGAWELGLDPIKDLTELLEEKGIRVGLVDGVDGFDACTFQTESGEPIIAVKRGLPGDRQRFKLAHELGHITLEPAEGVDPEAAARRFAGAFLVPQAAARKELGQQRHNLSHYELHLLKHKYGLSMQGWIYRSKDLGIISERVFKSLFRLFKQRGWHLQEPGDALPPEEPKYMERLVMRALAEDLISVSRAAELLGKPLDQLRQEVAMQHGGFSADFGH